LLFPTSKYLEKRKEISCYQQEHGEKLYDAWKKYKLLLKHCSGHKFSEIEIAWTFTYGFKPTTCMLVEASVGGTMKNKTTTEI